jgi:hypothetical protein
MHWLRIADPIAGEDRAVGAADNSRRRGELTVTARSAAIALAQPHSVGPRPARGAAPPGIAGTCTGATGLETATRPSPSFSGSAAEGQAAKDASCGSLLDDRYTKLEPAQPISSPAALVGCRAEATPHGVCILPMVSFCQSDRAGTIGSRWDRLPQLL